MPYSLFSERIVSLRLPVPAYEIVDLCNSEYFTQTIDFVEFSQLTGHFFFSFVLFFFTTARLKLLRSWY